MSLFDAHGRQLSKLWKLPQYRSIHFRYISPMFAPGSKRMKLEKSQKARGTQAHQKGWMKLEKSILDEVRSNLNDVGEPIANLMRTKWVLDGNNKNPQNPTPPKWPVHHSPVGKKLGLSGMGWRGENGWSTRSQGWRMCKASCLLFETDLLPLTNFNYYISSDNHSFTHTSRLEHSMSWIVAEGDSSLPCTLTKLVKWEMRVVALNRCSSFGERVGFFEVFWFSMCSHKSSQWVLNIFQK